jgi:hypothetical protein
VPLSSLYYLDVYALNLANIIQLTAISMDGESSFVNITLDGCTNPG